MTKDRVMGAAKVLKGKTAKRRATSWMGYAT
jgi:hypothetical protein